MLAISIGQGVLLVPLGLHDHHWIHEPGTRKQENRKEEMGEKRAGKRTGFAILP